MARLTRKTIAKAFSLMRVRLPDPQWREIKKASGLPDEARESLERELWLAREFHQSYLKSPNAATTRDKLRRIVEYTDDTLNLLIGGDPVTRAKLRGRSLEYRLIARPPTTKSADQFDRRLVREHKKDAVGYLSYAVPIGFLKQIFLASESDVLSALALPADKRKHPYSRITASGAEVINNAVADSIFDGSGAGGLDGIEQLCCHIWYVESLRFWCENAARALPTEKKGAHKSAQSHTRFVSKLDEILYSYAERHVSRRKHEHFVTLCFAAAGIRIRAGSIQQAMRTYDRFTGRTMRERLSYFANTRHRQNARGKIKSKSPT
jgi:hypothetical protein